MKKELDRNKRYNFSYIPKEMEEKVLEVIKNSSRMSWDIEGFNVNRKGGSLKFEHNDWYFQSNFGKDDLTFESLLDLEDVQIICTELTEEQIKEMANVFEANGYKIWDDETALLKEAGDVFRLGMDSEFYVNYKADNKTTITYDKFMELFGESGWYKMNNTNYLMYHDFENNIFYGFSNKEWFYNKTEVYLDDDLVKATNKEVEKRLIDYAKSIGFVGKMNYDNVYNEFWNESDVIMKDGIWAECVQDSKASLVEQLKTLEETRQKVDKEIKEVQKQLKEREKVLMFMIKKGVPTFAFHNSSQKYNLKQNGWKEISKEELIKEIEKYGIIHKT